MLRRMSQPFALEDLAPGPLPDSLPSGAAWPRIAVLADDAEGQRSATAQSYPALTGAANADFIWTLPEGARLAPGALAAAALATDRAHVDTVAGLRVVHDESAVAWLDVADDAQAVSAGDLLRRRVRTGAGRITIGRPVVLQRRRPGDVAPEARKLSIAALTDGGAGGGASIAHRRLVDAIRLAGHRIRSFALPSHPATAEWADRFPAIERSILAGGFDLVLAGNIHGATRRADVLARLHRHVPVAAITHDMFLLTGRCDIVPDCPLVHTGCTAACPTPTHYPYLARRHIADAYAGKRAFLAMDPPPLLLANSRWTEGFVAGLVGAGAVRAIDLPFPTQVFRPMDRAALRGRLGLPQDDVLILFIAVNADNPQKGLADIRHALLSLAGPGVGFVVVGRVDDEAALGLPNLVAPGPIDSETALAEWFAACDLHVTASRFESMGQTPIEAGLCGTPTVAYNRTGLSTAVIDGVSGLLCETTPDALATSVRALVEDAPRRRKLGAWGRLALESRNSHAASVLSLMAALRAHGLAPQAAPGARMWLDPALLGTVAGSPDPWPGAESTVAAAPSRSVRLLRRAKHRVWGRTMPLWMRQAARAAQALRE